MIRCFWKAVNYMEQKKNTDTRKLVIISSNFSLFNDFFCFLYTSGYFFSRISTAFSSNHICFCRLSTWFLKIFLFLRMYVATVSGFWAVFFANSYKNTLFLLKCLKIDSEGCQGHLWCLSWPLTVPTALLYQNWIFRNDKVQL